MCTGTDLVPAKIKASQINAAIMHGGKTFFNRGKLPPRPRHPDQIASNDREHLDSGAVAPNAGSNGADLGLSSQKSYDPVLLKAVNNPEFIPRVPQLDGSQTLEPNQSDTIQIIQDNASPDQSIIETFGNFVLFLTELPPFFDEQSKTVDEVLSGLSKLTTKEALAEIANILVMQSVFETGFRYNGARIAAQLYQRNLKIGDADEATSFATTFFTRVQQQFLECNDLIKDTDNPNAMLEVVGSCLFVGELLCQMKIDGKLNKALLHATLRFANLLISNPNDETVKCLGILLKLTGPTLDNEKDVSVREIERLFETVFKLCNDLSVKDTISKGSYTLLCSAYKLHTQEWGKYTDDSKHQNKNEELRSPKTPSPPPPTRVSPLPDWNDYESSVDSNIIQQQIEQLDDYDSEFDQFLQTTNST